MYPGNSRPYLGLSGHSPGGEVRDLQVNNGTVKMCISWVDMATVTVPQRR